nr:hypothetical protein CFP56_45672 [Quercus suber]
MLLGSSGSDEEIGAWVRRGLVKSATGFVGACVRLLVGAWLRLGSCFAWVLRLECFAWKLVVWTWSWWVFGEVDFSGVDFFV